MSIFLKEIAYQNYEVRLSDRSLEYVGEISGPARCYVGPEVWRARMNSAWLELTGAPWPTYVAASFDELRNKLSNVYKETA